MSTLFTCCVMIALMLFCEDLDSLLNFTTPVFSMKLNWVVLSRSQIMTNIPVAFPPIPDNLQDLPAYTDKLRQIGTGTWIVGATCKSKFNPCSIIAIGLEITKNLFLPQAMNDSGREANLILRKIRQNLAERLCLN